MESKPRILKKMDVVKVPDSTGIPAIDKPSVGTTKEVPPAKTMNPLITPDCVDYLNYRIQQEEYSARIYLSMAMWLENKGYSGAGALWKKYSTEEMAHADIARKFLLSFGIQPLTPRLDPPSQNYSGLPEIIKMSYEHEIQVSAQIQNMADHALEYKNHMLYELCLAYLKEQVEEHEKTQTWMDKLEAFGTDKIALRLLDNEMAG